MDLSPENLTAKDLIDSYFSFEDYHVAKVYFRLLIPNISVGRLVGDQGQKIKKISLESKASVRVERFTKHRQFRSFSRVLAIKGEPSHCVAACMQCVRILVEDQNVDNEDKIEFSLDFVLPDILVQHMEDGGNRYDKQDIFRSMAEKTSTHIQVSDKYLPYSTERVVRISVKSSKCFMELHQAVDLMAKQLAENITLFMCSPHNSYYVLKDPEHLLFERQLDMLFSGSSKSHCFYQ